MGNPLFRGGNAAHRKNNSGGWGESTDEDTASGNESDEEDDPEEDLRSLRNQSCRLPTLRPGTSGGALASLALARNGGGANGARLSTNGVVPGRGQSFSGPAGNPSRMMHQSLINRPTASVVEDSDSDQQAPSAQRRGASTLIGRGQTRGQLALNGPGVHRTKSNGNQLSTVAAGLSLEKLAHSSMYGSVQILSVDDEEVNQIVLEEILTSTGYQYARAMDGVEALEWLLAQDTLPDLILLDCMMPNMSGHEFCSMLRQYIPGSVLPVIMVSAKSDEDNIVEGLRSGSNDFVRKPYQREELLARIEAQLRLKNDSWWLAELVNNQDGRETQSMKLLKNILPESIIARMQSGQKFVADSHQHVVILFSDIVGFTNLSSKLPTAEVFLMLSNMFNAFDKLTDRFAVYKVETIGDAYMVAAGHDEDEAKARKGTPTERVVAMAKAMIDVVGNITAPNGERLRIRIGVHCGPAFAGVIGSKCPRYCFLGDTVNTASRMESLSFPMCVQVSSDMAAHWDQASDQLVTLGERDVKGKGRMTTFLLKYGDWEEAVKMWRETSSMREQAAVGGGPDRQVSNVTQSSAHQGTGRNSLESMASVLIHQQSLVGNGPPASHGDAAANGHAGMLAMPFRSHLYSNNAGYDSPIITSPPATAASSFSPAALQDKLNQLAAQLAAEQQAVKAAREEADRERLKASEVAARLRSALQQLASAPTGSGSNGPAPGTQQQQGGGGGGGGGSPDRDRNITLQQGISVGAGAVALVPAPSGIFEPDRASGALSLTFQQVDTTTSPERGAGNLPAPTFSAASSALPGGSGLLIRLAKASSTYGLAVPPVNIARLFAELGLESYLGRFEQEAIKLDMLLTMDQSQLDALGLRPLGYCMRVREAVVDLAKALLRMCEDRAALGN
uniref:Guanylate cyclase n=1 Tax=Chlamydomonas leiostraca TaxID=1034604 RepID=A0A7S0WIH5_9CHLO